MRNAFIFLVAILALAACSSSSGDDNNNDGTGGKDGCVETLPDCETSVCVGNYVRSCSEDGKNYTYELCWGQTCKDGICKQVACTDPGRKDCTGPSSYDLCLENQSMKSPKDCPAGTKCIMGAGACVATSCKTGSKACGWKSVLTCGDDGENWTVEDCDDGQYCDETAKLCLDMDSFCVENPQGSRCQDLETSLNCDSVGNVSAAKCTKNEVCIEGFCQPKICGINYEPGALPDTVSQSDITVTEDTYVGEISAEVTVDIPIPKDIPPLEKIPKAWCTLNGDEFEMYEIKFTSTKEANYVFKDKTLQVSMAKGANLMEVHFQGIEEGVVGNFNSDEPGSVVVWMVLNDGTTDPATVQWKWQSVSFNATLDQFDPVGGWVKGTFSGILEMDPAAGAGEPVEVLNGYFEVPREQ